MGMNFTAYIGHQLDQNQIYRMCHALTANSFLYINNWIEEIDAVHPEHKPVFWQVNSKGIGGTVEIYGPYGFDFTFSEKVCYFHHYIRWSTFLESDNFQKKLRLITYELTNYFQSNYAIYVPDNATKESSILDFIWDDENRSIEYITSWLQSECGNPKDTLNELINDDGYYIDYFEDIRLLTDHL